MGLELNDIILEQLCLTFRSCGWRCHANRSFTLSVTCLYLVSFNIKNDLLCICFSTFSGSLSDPPNIPGLSHFCEHMLFLGTKKYPKENEYSQFLSEHAGSSNAFTSGEHTNYYFDVSHEHLEGALDR